MPAKLLLKVGTDLPLHPAIVHLPIGIVFLIPLVTILMAVLFRKELVNKTWLIVIGAFHMLLAETSIVGVVRLAPENNLFVLRGMKTLLILILTSFLLIGNVSAETLIVTHANEFYDRDNLGGAATQSLMLDSKFTRILFLNNKASIKPTFDVPKAAYEERKSLHGEIKVDFQDESFSFAGGRWGACLKNSINTVVYSFEHDLVLNFMMKGVLVGTPNYQELPGVTTFAEIDEVLGRRYLLQTIVPEIRKIAQGKAAFRNHDLKNTHILSTNYRVALYIKGEHIESFGNGEQQIVFNVY